jgi:hypothetical protein
MSRLIVFRLLDTQTSSRFGVVTRNLQHVTVGLVHQRKVTFFKLLFSRLLVWSGSLVISSNWLRFLVGWRTTLLRLTLWWWRVVARINLQLF